MHREITQRERAAMGSRNRLKLGLFGANYPSGRAVMMVQEPVVTATKKHRHLRALLHVHHRHRCRSVR